MSTDNSEQPAPALDFSHEYHGDYEDQPHAQIEMSFEEWNEIAQKVLGYKYGPPIAWKYANGVLYLWGENLDDEVLKKASMTCPEVKREYEVDEMYDLCKAANRVERKFISAEVTA